MNEPQSSKQCDALAASDYAERNASSVKLDQGTLYIEKLMVSSLSEGF